MRNQQGAALLVLVMVIVTAASFLLLKVSRPSVIERNKITAAALAQAKDALIGDAAAYRDTHLDVGGFQDKVFGYLPCPDTDNDGSANPPCGGKDVTVVGRLPWKTLGLPPLRDSAGECLWYAVSGRFKNNPRTDTLNWDTAGQLIMNDAGGATLTSGVAAVIFSPHGVIGGQARTSAGITECGGNTTVAAYLDGGDPIYVGTAPAAGADTTLTVATVASIKSGANNDQGLWITPEEIFRPVKSRSDFSADISTLLTDLKISLDAATPPLVTTFITASTAGCPVTDGPTDQKKDYFRCNWSNNLKFAEGAGITVNGVSCDAVLIFVGERAFGQARVTLAEQSNNANYLESPNLGVFPGGGGYTGVTDFDPSVASSDIVRCIKP